MRRFLGRPKRRRSVQSCFHIQLLIAISISLILMKEPSPRRSSLFAQALSLPKQIRLRVGFPDDDFAISITLAKQLMNPITGISHKNNLIVAEHTATGERIGWAQIQSLGYAGVSTYPAQFEDGDEATGIALSQRNVQVQSTLSIEEDVDEEMWQEFEDDPLDFPNGLASLPWTKEYRAASQAASDRISRRELKLQAELAARPKLWELSSVYVLPEWRHRGIGRALVHQVLKQHTITKQKGNEFYAVLPSQYMQWYQQLGFQNEKHIPNVIRSKVNVGKITREDPVCLRNTLDNNMNIVQ